ncbi:hypothetical protein OM427_18555 [Halomonas sp. 18H]|uniref:hypothetical protein n=1 Tax=Halomonas almeriensis TaxID=308163 RepID=UPI00222FCABD|nr:MULTISPECIES: hypothetical protein [Halomonas]MCW4151530.1 hypothetical protein [Halomonas sp. 18H]MDN3552676.1 hypothetical protein [Halomonas almeriensis]
MASWVRYSHGSGAVISLLVAALLSVWWLLRPELLAPLPLSLRLPLVVLGVWAVGAAFVRPLAQDLEMFRLMSVVNSPWSSAALWGFALCTFGLALVHHLL